MPSPKLQITFLQDTNGSALASTTVAVLSVCVTGELGCSKWLHNQFLLFVFPNVDLMDTVHKGHPKQVSAVNYRFNRVIFRSDPMTTTIRGAVVLGQVTLPLFYVTSLVKSDLGKMKKEAPFSLVNFPIGGAIRCDLSKFETHLPQDRGLPDMYSHCRALCFSQRGKKQLTRYSTVRSENERTKQHTTTTGIRIRTAQGTLCRWLRVPKGVLMTTHIASRSPLRYRRSCAPTFWDIRFEFGSSCLRLMRQPGKKTGILPFASSSTKLENGSGLQSFVMSTDAMGCTKVTGRTRHEVTRASNKEVERAGEVAVPDEHDAVSSWDWYLRTRCPKEGVSSKISEK